MDELEVTTIQDEVSTEITAKEDTIIEFKIAAFLFKWYAPVQLTIALFGNVMIILIFSRKALRESVTSFLFRVLAVADTNMVLVALVPEVILEFAHSSTPYSTNVRCKVHAYLYFVGRSFAVWILLLIVLERFIGVNYPHKASYMVTHKRAKIAVMAVFVLICLLYSMIPFVMKAETARNGDGEIINYFCDVSPDYLSYFTAKVFPMYDACIYSLIPFILMLLANVSIIYRLTRSSRMRSQMAGSESSDLSGMTAMLLGISFAFIICTLPYNISALQRRNLTVYGPSVYLFWVVSAVLATMNHCINFYIYCLTGSRFRKELREMCGCKVDKPKRQQSATQPSKVTAIA